MPAAALGHRRVLRVYRPPSQQSLKREEEEEERCGKEGGRQGEKSIRGIEKQDVVVVKDTKGMRERANI